MYPRETLLRIVLLSLLLYAIASLTVTARELERLDDMRCGLMLELQKLEEENAALSDSLEHGLSSEDMLRLARERLGLVLPGEKVFYFTEDREG